MLIENINMIDAASLVVIFISSILAYFRGLSREILAIVGWIAAALLAFIVAPSINPLINKIPIAKEILINSCQLSILISLVMGFVLSLIVISLFIPMITNLIHQSTLNGLDRLLGLCFGALRGLLILIVVMIGYDFYFSDDKNFKIVEDSKTNVLIFSVKEDFKNKMPKTRPEWIMNRFDKLMNTCDTKVSKN
jgi:membrane protein required for colicin V production